MNIEDTCEPDTAALGSRQSPVGIEVELSDTQAFLPIDRAAIAALVHNVLEAEGVRNANISVAVVDDATIHQLNRRHLGHDWPTDVITFPLSEPGDEVLVGEIVVSAEMAGSTAREAGVSAQDELALYLVHGLLHLCGYDDKNPGESAGMRRREAEMLAMLDRSNTFAAALTEAADVEGREIGPWTD
jgi:probable rRNA maturation factor